jgi:hypothetical protein
VPGIGRGGVGTRWRGRLGPCGSTTPEPELAALVVEAVSAVHEVGVHLWCGVAGVGRVVAGVQGRAHPAGVGGGVLGFGWCGVRVGRAARHACGHEADRQCEDRDQPGDRLPAGGWWAGRYRAATGWMGQGCSHGDGLLVRLSSGPRQVLSHLAGPLADSPTAITRAM